MNPKPRETNRTAPTSFVQLAVLSTLGPTFAKDFNPRFIDQIASELQDVLHLFVGGSVELNGYTAPWDPEDSPEGQLTLRLKRDGQQADIGIIFGAADEQAELPYRRFFDREAFEQEPSNPHACGIFVANFDECWALCCRILKHLNPTSLHFSFGA